MFGKCLDLNPEGSGELHCLAVVCKYDSNFRRRAQAFFSRLSAYILIYLLIHSGPGEDRTVHCSTGSSNLHLILLSTVPERLCPHLPPLSLLASLGSDLLL